MMPRSEWIPDCCPVMEKNADGENIGRCFNYIGDQGVCSTHGQVCEPTEQVPAGTTKEN